MKHMAIHARYARAVVRLVLLALILTASARADGLAWRQEPTNITRECGATVEVPLMQVTGCCAVAELPGLALYYSFDQSNSVSVLDDSGHGITGRVEGAFWTPAGRVGGGYQFDGNDRIDVGNVFDLANGRTALTVSAWALMPTNTAVSEMLLAGKQQDYSPYTGWSLRTLEQRAYADQVAVYPQHAWALGTNVVAGSSWQNLVGVYEVGATMMTVRIYVNGQLAAMGTKAGVHGTTQTTAPLWLGARSPGGSQALRGTLDEVRIYDRALSESEIGFLATGLVAISYAEISTGDCPRVLVRTWTAADSCGQFISATQLVTLVDTVGPVLQNVPADTSRLCGSTLPAPPTVTALDACAGSVPVQFTEEATGGCPSVVTRTWLAVDACGNSSMATQHIELSGTLEPPVLLNVPANIEVTCDTIPPPAQVTATGLCTAVELSGLALYYSFDQSNSVSVLDDSGHGITGRVEGALWTPAGRVGGGYQFDGNDRIRVGNGFDLGNGQTALTVSAWALMPANTAVSEMLLVGKQQDYFPYTGWSLRTYQQRAYADLVAVYPQHVWAVATNTVTGPTWQHLTGVYELSSSNLQVKLYLNGQLVDSGTRPGPHGTSQTLAELWLGQRAPGGSTGLRGTLDEVKIFTRALSGQEISELYSGGLGVHLTETHNGACPDVYTRIWTAEDACGQTVAATQTITVVDADAPVLAGIPTDFRLSCSDPLPIPPPVTAWDACGGNVPVSYEQRQTGSCPDIILRTWLAVDACGNSTTAVQHIERLDLPVSNNLVLWYQFDQTSTTITDVSGSDYHGDNLGVTGVGLADCGGAANFDGTGYIDAHQVLDLTGTRTALTAVVRLRGRWTGSEMLVVGKNQDLPPYTGWGIRITEDGQALADLIGNYPERSSSFSGAPVLDDAWHVVACVFQVSDTKLETSLYVDQVLRARDQWTGAHATVANAWPLMVGCRAPRLSNPFVGLLDEVRLYDRALSAEEIAAISSDMSACVATLSRLKVNLAPGAAVAAGAGWRFLGDTTAWHGPGEVMDMSPGSHTIEFRPLGYWSTPSHQVIEVAAGTLITITGAYESTLLDVEPPQILSVQPPSGTIGLGASVQMDITVTDNVRVASVTVNEKVADELGLNQYRITVEGIQGLYNDYEVSATDLAGNEARATVTYAQSSQLDLAAIWDGMWVVYNPNALAVAFTWQVRNGSETGSAVVAGSSEIRFTTTTGEKMVDLLVDGVVVDSEFSSSYPPPPISQTGSVRTVDSDGDGFSNEAEDIAGTNPSDDQSFLALDVGQVGASSNGVVPLRMIADAVVAGRPGECLTFATSPDRSYALEYSSDLRSWQPVLDFQGVSGVAGYLAYTNRFMESPISFRLRATKRH